MKRGKFEKPRKKSRFLYYAALIALIAVFVFSAWYLADYIIGSRQQADEYNDLAAMVDAARSTSPAATHPTEVPGDPDAPTAAEDPAAPPAPVEDLRDEHGILVEYAPLYALNPDMAGWIRIEGTRVNYPVMHTPDLTDYYLHRNFSRQYNEWGCIYAREECDIEEPSDNITIYGHNMKDGSMFAGLNAYTDKSFWEEHRYVQFDTITEHHTYVIFAVFTTTASEGQGFDYHEFIDAADAAEFDEFIAECISLSLYDTGLVPVYGDKIICLSTCEYTQTNGRLVVAAYRIS